MSITVPYVDSNKKFRRKLLRIIVIEVFEQKEAEMVAERIWNRLPPFSKKLEQRLLEVMPRREIAYFDYDLEDLPFRKPINATKH